jgi:DNA-binding XRE family transcriptional regulator
MAHKKHATGGDVVVVPVPAKLRMSLKEVLATTDRFCDEYLDEEFKELCRDMAAVLVLEGFPLASGKAAGWAAGIVYSVGWVNFLGDPSQPHHMKAEEMARAIGVSPATLMNRARDIREGLGLVRMDPRWSTKGMLERHPLVWMAAAARVPRD